MSRHILSRILSAYTLSSISSWMTFSKLGSVVLDSFGFLLTGEGLLFVVDLLEVAGFGHVGTSGSLLALACLSRS